RRATFGNVRELPRDGDAAARRCRRIAGGVKRRGAAPPPPLPEKTGVAVGASGCECARPNNRASTSLCAARRIAHTDRAARTLAAQSARVDVFIGDLAGHCRAGRLGVDQQSANAARGFHSTSSAAKTRRVPVTASARRADTEFAFG